MITTSTAYVEVKVDVSADFEPHEAATRLTPEVPSNYELYSVKLDGVEIIDHLTEEQQEDILQQHRERIEEDMCAREEARLEAKAEELADELAEEKLHYIDIL